MCSLPLSLSLSLSLSLEQPDLYGGHQRGRVRMAGALPGPSGCQGAHGAGVHHVHHAQGWPHRHRRQGAPVRDTEFKNFQNPCSYF